MAELKSFNSERIYYAIEQFEKEAGDIDSLHLDDNEFYIKSEVDKVIAEKDFENRKMKRALWLARLRSLRNFSVLAYFQMIRAKGKESNMDFSEMAYRIDLARVKCRAKAEEYK